MLNEDLKKEWEKYLEQTKQHVRNSNGGSANELGVAPVELPGPSCRAHRGSLVAAMKLAKGSAPPEAAGDRRLRMCRPMPRRRTTHNWELLTTYSEAARGGTKRKAITAASDEVEDEENT